MNHAIVLLCAAILACPAIAEPRTEKSRPTSLPLPVPLEEMPAITRDALSKVMKNPTVTAVCPVEQFVAHPDQYQWVLDHPDRTAVAWRKLGVGAIEIKTLKDGRFYWKGDDGSELVWQTVAKGPDGAHTEKARPNGDYLIRHQVEVFVHTDSKTAALVTKMVGDAAPRLAQQGLEQMLMFFSGIAKYSHDKPEKAEILLTEGK
jgi:hypothetical protein